MSYHILFPDDVMIGIEYRLGIWHRSIYGKAFYPRYANNAFNRKCNWRGILPYQATYCTVFGVLK